MKDREGGKGVERRKGSKLRNRTECVPLNLSRPWSGLSCETRGPLLELVNLAGILLTNRPSGPEPR